MRPNEENACRWEEEGIHIAKENFTTTDYRLCAVGSISPSSRPVSSPLLSLERTDLLRRDL